MLKVLCLVIVVVLTAPGCLAFEPCTTCVNGEPITIPDGIIGMSQPLDLPDCKTLDSIVPFLDASSMECVGSQALGTICGCPIPEDACHLCGGTKRVTNPFLVIESMIDVEKFYEAPATRSFDCAYVEASLHRMSPDQPECLYAIDTVQEACCNSGNADDIFSLPTTIMEACDFGCPASAMEHPDHVVYGLNGTLTTCGAVQGLEMNRTDCQALADECKCQSTCPLCFDGSSVPNPDQPLDTEKLGIPETLSTCGKLEDSMRFMDPLADSCLTSQTLARLCNCPMRDNYCNICGSSVETVPFPDREYIWARGNTLSILPKYLQNVGETTRDKPVSCDMFESLNAQLYDSDDGFCWLLQLQSDACGCPNDDIRILVWVQVGSGIVSVFASLYLVVHSFSCPTRRSQTFFQCMGALSVFTLLGALSHVFATFFMPASGGYYMSIGNEVTCQIQGFLSQIGMTAIFYNIVLSVYYYYIFADKGPILEGDNAAWRKWIHVLLIGVGLALALAGIPFYNVGLTRCQVAFPPVAYSWLPSIFLFITPLCIATFLTMVTMLGVCFHVGARTYDATDRKHLFIQSLSYAMNFWSIWLPQLAQFGAKPTPNMFPMLIIASLTLPAQGTLNLLVYLDLCGKGSSKKDAENDENANDSETLQKRESTDTIGDEITEQFAEQPRALVGNGIKHYEEQETNPIYMQDFST